MTHLRPAMVIFVLLSIITGVLYPLVITGVAQALFHDAANGSLKLVQGQAVGSTLVGQPFDDPKYFWSRPSATGPMPYNAGASSGSNQGPTNPALLDAVKARIETLQAADPDNNAKPPVDLVTASGSGLDPHISPAAAEYQAGRVAKARGRSADDIRKLIERHTLGRTFNLLGEPRVNVLELNLALDGVE